MQAPVLRIRKTCSFFLTKPTHQTVLSLCFLFSTTRVKDSAVVVAQLFTSQRYLVLDKVLQSNISSLNLNPTTNPHAHFILHANKNIPLIYPLLHAFHTFTRFHIIPNFTFLGLKYPYPYLGRFMLERLTQNKVLQRLCSREISKLSQVEVSQVVEWWSHSGYSCSPHMRRTLF